MAEAERTPQSILVVTRDAETLNFLFTALATPDLKDPERKFQESPSRKDFAAVSLHDGQNYIFLTDNLNHAEEIIGACRLTQAFLAWNVRGDSGINAAGITLGLLEKSACPLYFIGESCHLTQLEKHLERAKYRTYCDDDGTLRIMPPDCSQRRVPLTFLGKDPNAILAVINKTLGVKEFASSVAAETGHGAINIHLEVPVLSQEPDRPPLARLVDTVRRCLRTPRAQR